MSLSPLELDASAVGKLEHFQERGARLVMLGALAARHLVYIVQDAGEYHLLVTEAERFPNVADIYPAAQDYQQEAHELWGVHFDAWEEAHGERGSFLHQDWHGKPPAFAAPDLPLPTPPYRGDALLRIPFGPVRGGVEESLLHRFHYLGEHIISLEQHLGYKHRGVEMRAASANLETLPLYAERVAGPNSVAFALAVCQAVERATGVELPPRALALRLLLAELERSYNHFHDIARLAGSTTLRLGQNQGHALQEWVQRLGARITGHRFMRGSIAVGGLTRDLELSVLARQLERLEAKTRSYFADLEATELFVDRLEATGRLRPEDATLWGAVGPVGRASGQRCDSRRQSPYGLYGQLAFEVPVLHEGDALARFRVRCQELLVSLQLLREVADDPPGGPVRAAVPKALPAEILSLGYAEGPRGEVVALLATDARGELTRVMLRGASRHNWLIFPETIHDSFLMDYAINEASWGLTVAAHDR